MGKTLLSRIDPVTQGERAAAEIPAKENTLYFCPSPLYGYGLDVLLRCLPESSALLCVEADPQLFSISQNAPPFVSATLPLALIQASQPEEVCAFVHKTWGQRRFRAIEEIRLGGGWQLFPQLYQDLAAALRREQALEWGNAMTMIRLGRLYARNLIRNLANLAGGKTVGSLDFGSSPVLALGAGPSLDSMLDQLSSLAARAGWDIGGREKRPFKILCVDTCLPALRERSIAPDLVVILESQHWNLQDFSGLRGWDIDAALDLSALPASARVLGGQKFFFSTRWTELALFDRLADAGILPEAFVPLGSVGLNAAALALRISSGHVITAGIDFSYTLDSFHARCTPRHLEQARTQLRTKSLINPAAAFREGTFSTSSKTGHPVRSDPAMRNYRNLFQQEFGGQERLFDIYGSGLPLGVKTVSPAEAFAILNGSRALSAAAGRRVPDTAGDTANVREKIAAFVRKEIQSLHVLKQALSGESPLEPVCLQELLDTLDYLWAHFPDRAGGGRPASGLTVDVSFLKRVRTEIEPFQKCWEMTLGELAGTENLD